MTLHSGTHSDSGAVHTTAAIPTLDEVEARHIAQVLEAMGGNQRRAARALGITRWSLARRVKKYGLRATALTVLPVPGAGVLPTPADWLGSTE